MSEAAATNVWAEFYVEDVDHKGRIDLHTMATDMAHALAALRQQLAAVVAERDALQEELRKLIKTANYNAALSISELRESMNVPKDQPIHGRCANCGEWHPIADMWAECTPCFDETVAKQARAERDALARDMQGVRARLATLERIAEGGWVSFRQHLGDWLLESSRYHGRGTTMRDAIDRVTLRPQLADETTGEDA